MFNECQWLIYYYGSVYCFALKIDGLYKLGYSSKAFIEKKLMLKLVVNDLFHDNGYTFRSNNGNDFDWLTF